MSLEEIYQLLLEGLTMLLHPVVANQLAIEYPNVRPRTLDDRCSWVNRSMASASHEDQVITWTRAGVEKIGTVISDLKEES